MRAVSRFESNLLRILQCFFEHLSVDQVLTAIMRPSPRPICLSREAVELVEHVLATGTVMRLARHGAWVHQRHLRGDQIRGGSLWQRSEPEELGLEFSTISLDFLIWLTEAETESATAIWVPPGPELAKSKMTTGDHFLLYLAADTMRDTSAVSHWFAREPFCSNPLIALMLPDRLGSEYVMPGIDFGPWMSGAGSYVLEAMQSDLANAWITLERDKCKISNCDRMNALGRVQESVLAQLFESAENHGRRDLCRFVLEAASGLLDDRSQPNQWIACLNTTGLRLAERTEAYESASAFLRSCVRLRTWHNESLSVGYFDEGYGESQLWKSLWESLSGEEVIHHAERITQELRF